MAHAQQQQQAAEAHVLALQQQKDSMREGLQNKEKELQRLQSKWVHGCLEDWGTSSMTWPEAPSFLPQLTACHIQNGSACCCTDCFTCPYIRRFLKTAPSLWGVGLITLYQPCTLEVSLGCSHK